MIGSLPLLVTRADPGGAATVERARQAGLDARHLPLFAARPLDWEVPDPAAFDALLLTSAQAARLGGPGLAALADLHVYAVGEATADAARQFGLTVAAVGQNDARTLVGAMASSSIGRLLWLCGRERTVLEAAGIALTAIPVYAVDVVPPPPGWDALITAPAVVMAHSARGATRIAKLAGDRRKHLTLLAISAAVAAAAGEGWAKKAISEHPDDGAMLAEAHALCHKGAQ
jgi:uroporphyrinogen-III synthase